MPPKKYRAASVPRFLRISRLAYLPPQSIIGSHSIPGENGARVVFDVVMLPVEEFQRMRAHIGLQVMPTAALNDMKELAVPPEESDAEVFARNYFQLEFGLKEPPPSPPAPFADVARECARRNYAAPEEINSSP
jgi:hypothetical protein